MKSKSSPSVIPVTQLKIQLILYETLEEFSSALFALLHLYGTWNMETHGKFHTNGFVEVKIGPIFLRKQAQLYFIFILLFTPTFLNCYHDILTVQTFAFL